MYDAHVRDTVEWMRWNECGIFVVWLSEKDGRSVDDIMDGRGRASWEQDKTEIEGEGEQTVEMFSLEIGVGGKGTAPAGGQEAQAS